MGFNWKELSILLFEMIFRSVIFLFVLFIFVSIIIGAAWGLCHWLPNCH